MMRAIQVKSPGAGFEIVNIETPDPKENEILIKVEACGICHGDVLAKEGHYPGIKYPIVPGHEVVGIVEKTGTRVTVFRPGQRVGVGWHGGHCNKCNSCLKGHFDQCEHSLVTGIHIDGGYAEYMVAPVEAVVTIPDELIPEEAAPLLCAGRTTFGALLESGAKAGDLVAVHGIGGLGHLALQYAVKLGFKTVAISRGTEKEQLAYKLGAHVYINTETGDAVKQLLALGGARVILCTAPNSKIISELIPGLGKHGEAIVVTGSMEPIQVPPMLLLGNERSVRGFVSGNINDAIRFSVLTKVIPIVEVFPMDQVQVAYDKMINSKVHFRSVLKMVN